jgi:hypothetical protein
MTSDAEAHVFVDADGNEITVDLLPEGAIRVRFKGQRHTAVTWHQTAKDQSVTIISPQRPN